MKKLALLVFIAALIGSVILTACIKTDSFFGERGSGNMKTEKREVAPFKAVEIGGASEIEITVGAAQSLEISIDDNIISSVKTTVSGDTLKIEREGKFSNSKSLKVRITVPELTGADISGASTANIKNVKADKLTLEASGASRITIEGEAKDLTAEANGASTIIADNLRTEKTKVEASGASKVSVFATESLDAIASGASGVVYAGNPKSLNKDASGASSVSAK
jgi:hypothetical protein